MAIVENVDGRWDGVRERVAALAAAGSALEIHGFKGHRFELHPVLSPTELAEVEREAGVRLPEDYRTFLLEVGSGGAGPGYGLERVERTVDGWQWRNSETPTDKLREPFRPIDAATADEHEAGRPKQADYPDLPSFDAADRAWLQYDERFYEAENFGAIALSHKGCAYYWLLVVSGPERGMMWDDCRSVGAPLVPLTRLSGERLTFHAWYMDWLSRAETALARTP